jgi:hypothetical protein
MAIEIKRIEREFLIKALYDEQIPLVYIRDRVEYSLYLERPAKNEMYLRSDEVIGGLELQQELSFVFNFRGQLVSFKTTLLNYKDKRLLTALPQTLYKNLGRTYLRVPSPRDLTLHFAFSGDRYSLSFPKLEEYEEDDVNDSVQGVNTKDLSGLMKQMAGWSSEYADGYKLAFFKERKFGTIDERIIAETGKILFIPSTWDGVMEADPGPGKRIITREVFLRFLENRGVDPAKLAETLQQFCLDKYKAGIYSEAWAPVLFQEYVIGYIHLWIKDKEKPPLPVSIIENLSQFAKILAFSLKINGYFDAGRRSDKLYEGKVIDISASGILFAIPHSGVSTSLLNNTSLNMNLKTPKRIISCQGVIVRRFKDNIMDYFGCQFLGMNPEDTRFLFEFIYGKPLVDEDLGLLAGNV